MFGGVGLGTFPLAGPFSPVSPQEAVDVLDAYFGAGGIYLDTAPTYAFGAVEELLGRYLKGAPRESFAVSTSCGYVREGDAFRVSGRREDVLRDAEESLARLQLDYLDIYISHIPDPDTPFEETAAALQELKDSGVVKRIGVSNVTADQLRHYRRGGEISVVQNRLSLVNRSVSTDFVAALTEAGADMVAYQVIERGLLSGAKEGLRRESDLRNRKPEFQDQRVRWLQSHIVDPLEELAAERDTTVISLAVAWARSQQRVTLAQVGATRPAQAALVPRLGRDVDAAALREIDQVYARAAEELPADGPRTIEGFMGIADYDVRSGSASGA